MTKMEKLAELAEFLRRTYADEALAKEMLNAAREHRRAAWLAIERHLGKDEAYQFYQMMRAQSGVLSDLTYFDLPTEVREALNEAEVVPLRRAK